MLDFTKWFMSSSRPVQLKQLGEESAYTVSKQAGTSGGFTVFKEKGGNYRWVAVSSNAFVDGDKEIVSTKALEEDAARGGERGPLRWWHEPQLDLGNTDFSGMHGKMLIESGTFSSPEIAQAIAQKAKGLSMSVGFVHPHTEPDHDGVFHNIKIFERSLLPVEKASNRFTKFEIVEDNTMNETKYKALQDLVGDALVAKILANAAVSEKEAMDEGLRYKEKKVASESKGGLSSLSDEEISDIFDQALAETTKELDELDSTSDDGVEYTQDWQSKIIEETTMKAKSQPVEDVEEMEGEDEEMAVMSSKKNALKDAMMASKGKPGKPPMMASKKAASVAVDPEDDEEADAAEDMEEEEDASVAVSDKTHGKHRTKTTKAYLSSEDESDAENDGEGEDEAEYDDEDEVTEKELGDEDEIAYLSPSELADLLTNTISEVVGELGVSEKMQTVTKELRTVKDVLREFDVRINASLEAVTTKEKNTKTLMAQIEHLSERLKELEGDAPKASKKGYRASQDGDTEIDDNHRLKGVEPTADPLDHFRSFLNGHK